MAHETTMQAVATGHAEAGAEARMEDASAMVLSKPSVGPQPGVNEELAAAWRDMEDRMAKLAKLSGKAYDPNLKPGDVMGNLERVKDDQKRKVEDWGKVKKVFNNTLTVIERVGGMVADAASQVFSPAGQCYNAINFVIAAYKSYASIFETLQKVFDRCSSFLGRLEKYIQGKMSVELGRVACEALRQYVNICDKALSLRTSRFFKAKTIMKVTFLGENEFDAFVNAIDELTNEEELERGADIYLNISKVLDHSTNMTNMWMEDKNEKAGLKQAKNDMDAVLTTLDFEKSAETWDSPAQAPIPTWSSTYQNIRHKSVEGTGQWVLREHMFKAWKKKDGGPPVLGVVGGPASGKSYLASTIISHLRTVGSDQQSSARHPVAFFFRDERKANAGIEVLGKSIIWQLVQNDASYMQTVASTCRSVYIEPRDLLTRLLLDNHKELKNIDAMFYIVINKIGDASDDVPDWVLRFLESAIRSSNKTVRVLFTATPGTIKKLKSQGVTCPIISMDKNAEDIHTYIDARMSHMEVLADTDDANVLELRETIQTRLFEQTKGNYDLIDKVLNEISTFDLDRDIYNALDGADRTLLQYLEDDLRKLNKSRSSQELEDINEIILWICFARERMTVEKMKAVLQNRNSATSLIPFEQRLRKKFLLFEIDPDGIVNFRSDKILAAIPERARTAKNLQRDNKRVQPGEVDILQHFLNTVCPPGLVQKLELDQHFQEKLNPQEEQIFQEDKNNAHFRLAKACLRALTSKTTNNLRVLRGYAVRNLIAHMSQVDLMLIDPDLKGSVGPDLLNLFLHERAIDNLLWANKALPHLPEWMFDVDAGGKIKTWLEDIPPDPQNDAKKELWLKEMREEQTITKTLSEPAVLRMAYYCFQTESPPDLTFAAFQIVQNFLVTFDILSAEPDQRKPIEPHENQIEAWCQQKLQVQTRNSLWHCQMAYVLDHVSDKSHVEARCRKAIDLDKGNWRASLLLAKTVESNSEAIGILKKLIKKQFGLPLPPKDQIAKDMSGPLADMAYLRGERDWAENRIDKAQKWFSVCVEYGTNRYSHTFNIMSRYQSAGMWHEIIDVIETVRTQSQLAPMVLALQESPESEKFHKLILDAVAFTKKFAVVDDVYAGAIDSASKSKNYLVTFNLRQAYASALSACRPAPMERVRMLLEDAARDVPYTNLDMARAFFRVGYRLGTIYLDKAKRAKAAGKDQEAEEYLQQLAAVKPEQVSEDQMRLPLRLFAARYHHVYGNEVQAQRSAHNSLRMAIELLSDDDSSNDLLAYMKIIFAVIPFGDVDNATAALIMMMMPVGPSRKPTLDCSCGCGFEWTTVKDIWWCMDCINVSLTTKCKEAVKDKNTDSVVCDETHEHFFMSGWDGVEAKDGFVPWRGEYITMDKWRKQLSKKYNLGV